MRARLMFPDRDFDPEHADRPGETDLVQDLALTTLWTAAAAGDTVVQASVRTALLEPLVDPSVVVYRYDVLDDCLAQPTVIRTLYDLARNALDQERQIYRASFFSRSSQALLDRSVSALEMFVVELQQLRATVDQCAPAFSSPGFRRFFAAVRTELDDDYFSDVTEHLQTLRFRDGLVASARLGRNCQGTDYVLRVPRPQNRNRLLPHHPPVKRPHYSRTMPRQDEGAHRDLAALRDRIVSLAADSLAQAAEHILTFFTALRAELAFYVGCLNLHKQLTARALPLCRPEPRTLNTHALSAHGLYDPCLGLRSPDPVQGNELPADGKPLILITGANQGGKSTFLRSLGLAQLMMQAGMPVPAQTFTASTVAAVLTHYAREEDPAMTSGKFDEELHRMSVIAQHIRPHSLLLCNESFAATNEREGAEIAGDVLRAFNQVGITVAFVTHLYELAHRFQREHSDTTLFLRADRDETGRRSFQLLEAAPQPTSHARDLYERTFSDSAAPDIT